LAAGTKEELIYQCCTVALISTTAFWMRWKSATAPAERISAYFLLQFDHWLAV
jgi:hypothetical protein